jgi:HD-GYP domain-containing protein (c-di-GMP phosphodiesterase class II)
VKDETKPKPPVQDIKDETAPKPPVQGETTVTFTARQLRRAREVLARLSGARRSQHLYPQGHPAVRESAAGLMEVLSAYFDEGFDVPLTFFENEVLLGHQLLPEESVMFDQLVRSMSDAPANSVTFLKGLQVEELERAMPLLTAETDAVDAAGGLETAARAAGLTHVMLATAKVYEKDEHFKQMSGKEAAHSGYTGALELLRDLDHTVRSDQVASAERVRGVVRGLVENVLGNRHALLELSGLKDYDEYTFFHSVNVAILSLALGSALSSDRRFLNTLGVGALMHDVGKMTIDLATLNKTDALTTEEWDQIRLHPLRGAKLAASMPGLDRASIVVILEHHMRLDLDGYPGRRPPRPQHLMSRIVAVADAYDAMTSRRTYSEARLPDESMEVLARNSGTAFDPVLVRLFVQIMGVYPPRSVVRLSTGEVGVVVRPSGTDMLRPAVRVIADSSGAFIEPHDIELSAGDGPSIEACLDPTALNVDVDDYL